MTCICQVRVVGNVAEFRCPKCKSLVRPSNVLVPKFKTEVIEQGQSRKKIDPWGLIHRYPIEHSGDWNPSIAKRWYEQEFLPLVPIHLPDGATCGCQSHWVELTDQYHPDFSSAEAFERWAFDRHDDVSRLHSGADRITWEQSQRLWRGPRVGFLATSFVEIGGTETFHQTLLPSLRKHVQVSGFWASLLRGDTSLLKVPYFSTADELIENSETLVVWGLQDLAGLLKGRQRRIISVHHSDITSDWSNSLQEQSVIDEVVCVNPDVAEMLSLTLNKPVRYLPNPMPPMQRTDVDLRAKYGLGDRKVILWPHRDSPEKQPFLARAVAAQLPPGFVMVMTTTGQESPNVVYVGRQQQSAMGDWLAISHCLLSLAQFEGFGYSAAEAMLQGVPVVSYAQGICNEGNATIISPNADVMMIARHVVSPIVISPESTGFLASHQRDDVGLAWANLILSPPKQSRAEASDVLALEISHH